ncbi:MAG: 4'-phosphopantetheinyl transferase superfamily protein [Ruminiclostridium sp.]|nr:4'-phosphopantetheinyl transferase superfamily protein [Ruminiclostridium sp.]
MNIYITNIGVKEKELIPFLSAERLKKTNNITNEKVRREKIYAYGLLRYSLFEERLTTSAPAFSYGQNGKPFLTDYPDIHFNLSHADGFCACAVSDEEIGLDIQDYRPLKADISRKICTPAELKAVNASDDPQKEICRLWCMKEARGKLTGKGFAEGFDKIETAELIKKGELYSTVAFDGLFVSICGFSPLPEINIIRLTEEKLFEKLCAMSEL